MLVNNSIVVPMIADCIDYEVACSGRYMPGMISSLFTFVDKLVLSLNSVIVGFLVMLAGFTEKFPTVDTPYSSPLFWIGMICFCGLPFVGWVVNLVCMKYYPLDRHKMAELRERISVMKLGMAGCQDNIHDGGTNR